MRKRILATILCVTLMLMIATFFHLEETATANHQFDVSRLVNQDVIVVTDNRIYNLNLLNNFYINSQWGVEDEIHIILNPYTRNEETFHLMSVDGTLFLSDGSKNINDDVSYERLFRIFRNNQIQFILECSNGRQHPLLAYSVNG